jgi:alkaline phosphatase
MLINITEKLMSRLLLTVAAVALTANPVLAQVMLPTDNQWFINGQATLQERLSAAPNTNTARNVILFVADGNGVGTNYATRLFQGQQMGLFGEEHVSRLGQDLQHQRANAGFRADRRRDEHRRQADLQHHQPERSCDPQRLFK